MTPTALRRALGRHRITQVAFARTVGVDPSTVRRWLAGAHAIPHWVALVVESMEYVPLAELARYASRYKSST